MKIKQLQAFISLLLLSIVAEAQTNIFESGGYVGIGTTTPANRLEVAGTTFNRITASVSANVQTGFQWVRTGTSATNWEMYVPAGSTSLRLFNDADRVTFLSNGNVGIGTITPFGKLNVSNSGVEGLEFGPGYNSNASRILSYNRSSIVYNKLTLDGSALEFQINDIAKMLVDENGYVGIGTLTPNQKLCVAGNANIDGDIKARKITITQTTWPDYVFHPSYELKPLAQVAKYIKQNQHLPDVPSAKEIEDNGISLGDNQALLLKKIEELTLYLLKQDKEIKRMKAKVAKLEKKQLSSYN